MKSDAEKGMNGRRIGKIREIEAEFQEPFWDVVRGFAEMGYSRRETARILGYNQGSFLLLVRGRPIDWRHGVRAPYEHSQVTKQRAAEAARRRAKRYFVGGAWRTPQEIARDYGIQDQLVRSRAAQGVKGDALAYPPMSRSEIGRRGAVATNRKRRRHVWRDWRAA